MLELIPTVVSAAALLVSLSSLYYTHLHRTDIIHIVPITCDLQDHVLEVEVAVCNAGSRPIFVRQIRLEGRYPKKGPGVTYWNDPSCYRPFTPILIPRNEIRSFRIRQVMGEKQATRLALLADEGHLDASWDGKLYFACSSVFVLVDGYTLSSTALIAVAKQDGSMYGLLDSRPINVTRKETVDFDVI